MKKKQPRVSIIIVNYNGKHFLKDCFDSLLAMDYPREKLEIILVDNGSIDGSLEFAKRNYPEVRVFRNDANNYARANNLGIKHAKGEWIVLANNDLVFDKEWLEEMLKGVSSDDRIGAATGKVLFPDGKLQGTGHYELPDFYWSDRGFLEEDTGQYDHSEEMQSISHCATLYRRACLKDVGPLDEDFNMFLEDVDMSLRARQKGWKLLYVPGARVFHKFHGTAKKEKVDFLCERNRLLWVAKHYPKKLSAVLFGKGYFTALNNRNDLIKVLPELLQKMIATHGQKSASSNFPEIFGELEKIVNLEKDHLVKELSAAKKALEDLTGGVLPQRDKLIETLNGELARMNDELARVNGILPQRDKLIETLNGELARMNDELARVNGILPQRDKLIETLNGELARMNDELARVNGILPQRDKLIETLNGELARMNDELARVNGILPQRDKLIEMLNGELSRINNDLKGKNAILDQKEQQLDEKNQELAKKNRQLSEKDGIIAHGESCIRGKENEANELRLQIKQIYESEVFRYIVKPIWQTLIFLRSFKRKPPPVFPPELLVIKPFCVSAEDTRKALGAMRAARPEAFVILVANSSPADAEKLNAIESIQEMISYSFYGKRLTFFEHIRLIRKLRKRRIEEALVVIGDPVYYGYRKAKALAFLSGAKRVSWYFSRSGNHPSFNLRFSLKGTLHALAGMVSLSIVTVLFLIFIVFPSKVIKSFKR